MQRSLSLVKLSEILEELRQRRSKGLPLTISNVQTFHGVLLKALEEKEEESIPMEAVRLALETIVDLALPEGWITLPEECLEAISRTSDAQGFQALFNYPIMWCYPSTMISQVFSCICEKALQLLEHQLTCDPSDRTLTLDAEVKLLACLLSRAKCTLVDARCRLKRDQIDRLLKLCISHFPHLPDDAQISFATIAGEYLLRGWISYQQFACSLPNRSGLIRRRSSPAEICAAPFLRRYVLDCSKLDRSQDGFRFAFFPLFQELKARTLPDLPAHQLWWHVNTLYRESSLGSSRQIQAILSRDFVQLFTLPE